MPVAGKDAKVVKSWIHTLFSAFPVILCHLILIFVSYVRKVLEKIIKKGLPI